MKHSARWHNYFIGFFMAQEDTIFNGKDFENQRISCSNCGWEGTGAETKLINFYGLGKSQQVNCPRCDASLGNLPRDSPIQGGADLPGTII